MRGIRVRAMAAWATALLVAITVSGCGTDRSTPESTVEAYFATAEQNGCEAARTEFFDPAEDSGIDACQFAETNNEWNSVAITKVDVDNDWADIQVAIHDMSSSWGMLEQLEFSATPLCRLLTARRIRDLGIVMAAQPFSHPPGWAKSIRRLPRTASDG